MKTTLYELLTAVANAGAPNATVSIDEDGQVTIHTNLTDVGNDVLEEMQ